MNIFAVYARVELEEKPSWLDDFRAKYNLPFHEDHVTLKQACFIEEDQVADMEEKLAAFLKGHSVPGHSFTLTFDRLNLDEKDGCIMINMPPTPALSHLQKGIMSALASYRNYCLKESEEWETNFAPHLTIARDLTVERFREAVASLGEDVCCVGKARELVLAILKADADGKPMEVQERIVYKI